MSPPRRRGGPDRRAGRARVRRCPSTPEWRPRRPHRAVRRARRRCRCAAPISTCGIQVGGLERQQQPATPSVTPAPTSTRAASSRRQFAGRSPDWTIARVAVDGVVVVVEADRGRAGSTRGTRCTRTQASVMTPRMPSDPATAGPAPARPPSRHPGDSATPTGVTIAHRLHEVVDVGVSGGEVPAGPGRDPAAQGGELVALRVVPQGQAVRAQSIRDGRSDGAAADARDQADVVDLDHAGQAAQVEAQHRPGPVAALDAADHRGAAAERHHRDTLGRGPSRAAATTSASLVGWATTSGALLTVARAAPGPRRGTPCRTCGLTRCHRCPLCTDEPRLARPYRDPATTTDGAVRRQATVQRHQGPDPHGEGGRASSSAGLRLPSPSPTTTASTSWRAGYRADLVIAVYISSSSRPLVSWTARITNTKASSANTV